jgi:hypothetical protein
VPGDKKTNFEAWHGFWQWTSSSVGLIFRKELMQYRSNLMKNVSFGILCSRFAFFRTSKVCYCSARNPVHWQCLHALPCRDVVSVSTSWSLNRLETRFWTFSV